MNRNSLYSLALYFTFSFSAMALSFEIPKLTSFITDQTNHLRFTFKKRLDSSLKKFQKETGHSIKLFLAHELSGESIESMAAETLKEQDGVILLIAHKERKIKIHASPLLQEVFNNSNAHRIIQSITPFLKSEKYEDALLFAAHQMTSLLGGELRDMPIVRKRRHLKKNDWIIICIIIFLVIFFGRGSSKEAKELQKWKGKAFQSRWSHARGIQQSQAEQILTEINQETSAPAQLIVLKKSDLYPAAHFRLAIMMSLCSSLLMYYIPWDFGDPIWFLWVQIPFLLIGYLLAFNSRLKRFFSTSTELREEVQQKAMELYLKSGHHERSSHSGPFILVSLLEKRLEMIVHSEINEQVPQRYWTETNRELSKSKDLEVTLKKIIEALDLKNHFPLSQKTKEESGPIKEIDTQVNSKLEISEK